ncbi:hypothetical protein [Streptomyces sp. HPF1205]|uniref:hypothetical protein n=1 Tax=Streptomyces sp. HPF1205 TaxID=2873262 RepID=UPI001CED15D1|nr:hypothetical protein [Streptomyces sp. HPF1205]
MEPAGWAGFADLVESAGLADVADLVEPAGLADMGGLPAWRTPWSRLGRRTWVGR